MKNICAVDTENDYIRVWNAGTNKLIDEIELSEDMSYQKWKRHSDWAGSTIMILDKSAKD